VIIILMKSSALSSDFLDLMEFAGAAELIALVIMSGISAGNIRDCQLFDEVSCACADHAHRRAKTARGE
jgi:hypothetical protein